MRDYPIVPGIDLAGEVVESQSQEFAPGDQVLAHGYDIGTARHGGYAERRPATPSSSTGKTEAADRLRALGAAEVIGRLPEDPDAKPRPLGRTKWAGAVDCVGGATLADVLSTISYGGAVAASGLTGGPALNTTVMPVILRGVALLGIDSVQPGDRTASRAVAPTRGRAATPPSCGGRARRRRQGRRVDDRSGACRPLFGPSRGAGGRRLLTAVATERAPTKTRTAPMCDTRRCRASAPFFVLTSRSGRAGGQASSAEAAGPSTTMRACRPPGS